MNIYSNLPRRLIVCIRMDKYINAAHFKFCFLFFFFLNLQECGLRAYRFSISWSRRRVQKLPSILGQFFRSQPARLLPNGRGKMNLKAYDFYNSLLVEFQGHMG